MDLLESTLARQNHSVRNSAPIQMNDIVFRSPPQMVMAIDHRPTPQIGLRPRRKRAGNCPSHCQRKLSSINV